MRRPNLDAIRRRVAAATPGTWKTGSRFGDGVLGALVVVISGKHPALELDCNKNGRADAAFIAHARQDVPALLAEVDRLQADLTSATRAALRPVDDPDHPLHGDPDADRPDELLAQFAQWLDSNGQLTPVPAGVANDLEDMVGHFMADRREARTSADR